MSHDRPSPPGGQPPTGPRPTRGGPVPCSCRDTIAITIDVAGHRATLHLCRWCGDSWDIDGSPASRADVHLLVPKSRALSAIWRRTAPAAGPADRRRTARLRLASLPGLGRACPGASDATRRRPVKGTP